MFSGMFIRLPLFVPTCMTNESSCLMCDISSYPIIENNDARHDSMGSRCFFCFVFPG